MARRLKKRLEERKKAQLRKLANPKDKDDPRWVTHKMNRLDKEIAKKDKAAEHKQDQRKVGRNRRVTKHGQSESN